MKRHTSLEILFWLVLVLSCAWGIARGDDYPIVGIRQPRVAGETNPQIQQVFDPISLEKSTDLVLFTPGESGWTEEVLVAGGNGACFDPVPSLDGTKIFYAKVHDLTKVNSQVRARAAISGADIFVIDLATRVVTQLTHQEFVPNTGVAQWSPDKWMQQADSTNSGVRMGVGVYNCGPCPTPDGKLVFCSSRNGFKSPKSYSFPNLQLFRMDVDGRNLEQIGHLNIGSALHPILLKSGAIAWSSWEMQALRDSRMWGLWEIHPDGTNWGPLFSAFNPGTALHWQSQLTDGRIVVAGYYNLNNWGFGSFYSFFRDPPGTIPATRFGSWFAAHATNPSVRMPPYGSHNTTNWTIGAAKIAFSPSQLAAVTEFANDLDIGSALDKVTGAPMGKVTQPAGAPDNHLLCVYSPGRVNTLPRPVREAPWCQIVRFDATQSITSPSQLEVIKADPAWHYQQPHAVVPWPQIYGSLPSVVADLKNDGTHHALLPAGTPYGLIGSSSLYKRDSAPGYRSFGNVVGNLTQQGADVGLYSNSEIWGVRIVQLEPQSNAKYVPTSLPPQPAAKPRKNHFGQEIESILAEIPARKGLDENGQLILDPDGNPDTSFLARIPADVPFGMQLISAEGEVLAREGTWKQLRPGENRHDCGGCHAHSQVGTDFSLCAAAKPEYQIATYAVATTPEFTRDIKPIIDAHCASCHTAEHPTGLDLSGSAESQYNELASYTQAGLDLVGQYIMPGRARDSLLVWKLHGTRRDGRPGTVNGARMPLDADPLSPAEIRTVTTWIDLGCAYGEGALVDDLRPTLTVYTPEEITSGVATTIYVGALDTEGLAGAPTLKLDGTELVLAPIEGDNTRWQVTTTLVVGEHSLAAEVTDQQGNVTKVNRVFTALENPRIAELEALIAAATTQIAVWQAELADLLGM